MKKLIIVFLCVVSLLGVIPSVNVTKVNADVQTDTSVGTNSIAEQFNNEVAQNGGLQKIDNLVLKELIHKYFPLGEEKESQILGELNHQRMEGKVVPIVIAGALLTEWVAMSGLASLIATGVSSMFQGVVELGNFKWIPTTNGHWVYCNGYGTCKNGWQWLYASSVKHNRWFNFKNRILEVGYKWVKYGSHWMFLDNEYGYATNETKWAPTHNGGSTFKNYFFDANGYCTNP